MKSKLDLKITLGMGISIFIIHALFTGVSNLEISSSISQSVTVTILIRFIFIKWIWKYIPKLECLHKTPLLEGEWKGKYISNYTDTTTSEKKSGTVKVIISQPSIFSIKITQISEDSTSRSYTEEISVLEDGHTTLAFSYLLDPKAINKDKHQISYGSARYTLFKTENNLQLKGNYWTDQGSTGYMELEKNLNIPV